LIQLNCTYKTPIRQFCTFLQLVNFNYLNMRVGLNFNVKMRLSMCTVSIKNKQQIMFQLYTTPIVNWSII